MLVPGLRPTTPDDLRAVEAHMFEGRPEKLNVDAPIFDWAKLLLLEFRSLSPFTDTLAIEADLRSVPVTVGRATRLAGGRISGAESSGSLEVDELSLPLFAGDEIPLPLPCRFRGDPGAFSFEP